MKLFVSPHNDDAVLFGSFTLQREEPVVLTVFDSYLQVSRGHMRCDCETRRLEDVAAVRGRLGCPLQFGAVRDDESKWTVRTAVYNALAHWRPDEVWLPAVEHDGHEQHNLIGEIGPEAFVAAKIHRYLTYTRSGGKSRGGTEVVPTGAMILKKLQALACYRSQIEIDELGCWPHFMDLREYSA